jgi:hypothetical protein
LTIVVRNRKLLGVVAAVLLGPLSAVGEPATLASAQAPGAGFQALTPARIVDMRSDLAPPARWAPIAR